LWQLSTESPRAGPEALIYNVQERLWQFERPVAKTCTISVDGKHVSLILPDVVGVSSSNSLLTFPRVIQYNDL
ncbi:MAG TPA: hypothetical protein VMW24_08245, partial [Sedimentisphaerales bacterium]|nr:hypothetical protein [Sedimentisphaerales bacterium]